MSSHGWGRCTPEQYRELYEDHGNGDARFQYYSELLRITGWPDTPDNFQQWSEMAFIALSRAHGKA